MATGAACLLWAPPAFIPNRPAVSTQQSNTHGQVGGRRIAAGLAGSASSCLPGRTAEGSPLRAVIMTTGVGRTPSCQMRKPHRRACALPGRPTRILVIGSSVRHRPGPSRQGGRQTGLPSSGQRHAGCTSAATDGGRCPGQRQHRREPAGCRYGHHGHRGCSGRPAHPAENCVRLLTVEKRWYRRIVAGLGRPRGDPRSASVGPPRRVVSPLDRRRLTGRAPGRPGPRRWASRARAGRWPR